MLENMRAIVNKAVQAQKEHVLSVDSELKGYRKEMGHFRKDFS